MLDQDMKLREMALRWGYRVRRREHDFLVQSWYLKGLTAILDLPFTTQRDKGNE